MDRTGGYAEYGFVAEFYDHVVPYRDRKDVEFFVELGRQSGGPVLELGCGTGRILIPSARAGVTIVGLDMSAPMLAVCRDKLSREPEAVRARTRIVLGDMRSFELNRSFELVTIPFRPFQHLTTVEDQLSCLSSIHRHLAPGGRLVLDLFNPSLPRLAEDPSEEEVGEEPEFEMPGARRVVRRYRTIAHDRFRQILDVEMIYYVTHPSGRTERLVHRFPMRYLLRFEAEHLLVRSGFRVEKLYADCEKNSYGSKYPGELVFIARKA